LEMLVVVSEGKRGKRAKRREGFVRRRLECSESESISTGKQCLEYDLGLDTGFMVVVSFGEDVTGAKGRSGPTKRWSLPPPAGYHMHVFVYMQHQNS
jgi:hypothetical protein